MFGVVIWRYLLVHRYLQNITIPAAFVTKTVGDTLKGLIRPTRKDRKPTAMVSMDWTDILPRSEVVCPPHPAAPAFSLPVAPPHRACLVCVAVCYLVCFKIGQCALLGSPPITLMAASSAAAQYPRFCTYRCYTGVLSERRSTGSFGRMQTTCVGRCVTSRRPS